MKILTLILWLGLSGVPAFAQTAATSTAVPTPCSAAAGCGYHGAPAPLIGLGIPAAFAIGGVLLGAKFLRRRR